MLKGDIAGSAQTQELVQFCCGRFCVLRGSAKTGALGVLRARTCAPRSRAANDAANDNGLAWPYLAFAEDWYASC